MTFGGDPCKKRGQFRYRIYTGDNLGSMDLRMETSKLLRERASHEVR